MRFAFKYLLSSVATVTILAACGGNDPSSTTAVSAQEKAAAGTTNASSYATVVQESYISYFGRSADPVGLANFENRLLAAGAPTDIQDLNNAYSTNIAVKNLVKSFETNAESVALYGNSTTIQFVTAIYQNVLGRAPDTAGLNYWANAISKGSLTQGNAALVADKPINSPSSSEVLRLFCCTSANRRASMRSSFISSKLNVEIQ